MKNTKKALAALALSATLAMGAVPAFADDAAVNKSGSFDASGDTGRGTTQLNIKATASQIQATLPIDITVITPAAGGSITAPSADAYKIVNNNSTAALYVNSIEGKSANNWEFKSTLSDPGDITTPTVGQMKLSVKAGSSAALPIVPTKTEIKGAAASYFAVPANGSLGLTLEGATAVAKTLSTDAPLKAAQVEYTVGLAPLAE